MRITYLTKDNPRAENYDFNEVSGPLTEVLEHLNNAIEATSGNLIITNINELL